MDNKNDTSLFLYGQKEIGYKEVKTTDFLYKNSISVKSSWGKANEMSSVMIH